MKKLLLSALVLCGTVSGLGAMEQKTIEEIKAIALFQCRATDNPLECQNLVTAVEKLIKTEEFKNVKQAGTRFVEVESNTTIENDEDLSLALRTIAKKYNLPSLDFK